MIQKAKISLGIPFYGSFSGEWTTQMLQFVSVMAQKQELREVITYGSMTADHNRNGIVHEFLKSDAEWLFWIDSDTMVPVGAVERMLAHGRTLVSGLYYGKNPPHPPIAYYVHNGAYTPISNKVKWEKGEILEIDAPGMGCMLTHRSVFEDIEKNYEVYQIPGGGILPVHKNDILGDIKEDAHHEHDGKVYKGQLRLRVTPPTLANLKFPYFAITNNKTEDMFFMELAARVGHKPVLDTSVECSHLRMHPYSGEDYRNEHGR